MRSPETLALASLLLIACGVASESTDSADHAVGTARNLIDLRADTNRDGVVSFTDPSDDKDEETWTDDHGAVFLANIDDDTKACPTNVDDIALAKCNDAADEVVNGADDALDLARLKTKPWPDAPAGTTANLSFTVPGSVRLFKVKGDSFEVIPPGYALSAEEIRGGMELAIEGKDIVRDPTKWDGFVDVSIAVQAGEQSDTDTVRMRVAPVVASNHLDTAVSTIASAVPDRNNPSMQDPGNAAMVAGLDAASQAAGVAPPRLFQTYDRWTQDFFEPGYMTMPGPNGTQRTIRVNLRSANVSIQYRPDGTPFIDPRNPLRVAGRIVFLLRGKDSAGVQAFDLARVSDPQDNDSLNSFGNMETIPPYTFGGKRFPVGRILRGSVEHADPAFTKMLAAQRVQAPVNVPTDWLLVGHVDETISFVKAPTPRGWAMLANDARMARNMLEQAVAAGHGDVPMFVGKKWITRDPATGLAVESSAQISIKQVLADEAVMAASAHAAVEVDEQVRVLKQETGITDAEIVRVPFLHMDLQGYSVAYHPGTVNGIYITPNDFASPDPHGPVIGGKDIFKASLEQSLAALEVKVHWVEDWDGYHINLGEVHCGSNAIRAIPQKTWWMGAAEVDR
jgi:protein-arginine deiminase